MRQAGKDTQLSTDNVCTIYANSFVIRGGDYLFRTGDKLEGIYRINSGSVKVFRITEEGELQIVGFYMKSDLIGLDALVDGVSRSTAIIMDTSNISLIPFETILNNVQGFDYHTFIHKLGESYNREREHSIVLSQPTNRRLAWFLVEYSDAMTKRGLSATVFDLPMSRTDIAMFLGMAVETLCRMFAVMKKTGLLRVNRRCVEVLDPGRLRDIADGHHHEEEGDAWMEEGSVCSKFDIRQ